MICHADLQVAEAGSPLPPQESRILQSVGEAFHRIGLREDDTAVVTFHMDTGAQVPEVWRHACAWVAPSVEPLEANMVLDHPIVLKLTNGRSGTRSTKSLTQWKL